MKKIKLTQNQYALIDDADFEFLSQWKWSMHTSNNNKYAYRKDKNTDYKKDVFMHRLITKCPKYKEVDHIDGNSLNNQRKNLRICTRSENAMNTGISKTNTSGFKGVMWHKRDKAWRAGIKKKGKHIHLGNFKDKEEAIEARRKGEIKYHGRFRRIIK